MAEFEQYINQQSLLISVESDAGYAINSQTHSFLTGNDNLDISIPNRAVSEQPVRQPIKHLLIGSPLAVSSTQRYLHQRGIAQVGDWSRLLPTVNPKEVMSILSRQIVVQ